MMHVYKPEYWSWVTLIGPDAKDFLHRITTVHVNALQPGQGAPGMILSAQGKIRAYFRLWNFGPNEYSFEFDAGRSGRWKTDLLAAIDQFTFAEKITLTDVSSQLETRWIFPDPETLKDVPSDISNLSPGETIAIDEEIRVCHQGTEDFGRTWITVWGRPARLNQWLDRLPNEKKITSLLEIERWRIHKMTPWVDHEINPDSVIPVEIGLKNAIAENKGCYPGQEVIEKIISLGSPPRRLCLIQGSGEAPAPGDTVQNLANPPGELGQVTSSRFDSNGFEVLALLRKIHAKEGMQCKFSNRNVSSAQITSVRDL